MSARVLIIDDDLDNVAMLETFLSEDAEEIRSVTNSKYAESVFAEFVPDITLLDLHTPDPDGLEILRRLRSVRAT